MSGGSIIDGRDDWRRSGVALLRIHSNGKRRFKPRIWLGRLIVKIGFWIMGAKAEAAE